MKKIEKIAFYEREKNGEKIREACVFYENGKYKILSYKDGQKETIRYAKENGFKSIDELKILGDINTYSEDEFMCVYPEVAEKVFEKDSKKLDKLYRIINSLKEKNRTRKKVKKTKETASSNIAKKIKRKIKKIAIFAGILFLGTSAFKLVKNNFNDNNKNIESDNNKDTNKNLTKNKNYDNIYDILYDQDANINKTKKSAIFSITSYLTHYNSSFADEYTSSKTDAKLAHTWDEALINYLVYNNLSQEEINQIFDTYSLDLKKLEKAYESSIKQDIQAYTVATSSTGKEKLIISDKGQDLYTEYEKMIIAFNSKTSANTYERKLRTAEQFYKEVKKDFYLDTNDKKEIADYKLSLIPIIKTFNTLTKNMDLENKLTDSEKDYLNYLGEFDCVYKKIAGYKNKLDSYNRASQALQEENDEISYKELKKLVINELKVEDHYNVASDERNIKDNEDYQKQIKESKKKVTKVATTTTNDISNTNTNNNNNSSNNSVSNTSVDSKDNSSSSKSTKKKKEKEKDTTDKKENTITNEIEHDSVKEEFKEVTDETVIDEPIKQETTATEEPVEEWHEITEENNNTSLDNSNTSEKDLVENAEINEEYVDENGNLDDSVKDITTDSTGSVSSDYELPDPNNEEVTSSNQSDYEAVAEQIVEDMANDTSENFTEVKVLTK